MTPVATATEIGCQATTMRRARLTSARRSVVAMACQGSGPTPLPLGEAARSAGEGVRTSSSVRAHRHPSPQPSPRGRGRKPQLDNEPIKLDTVVSIKDGSIEEAL